jgi:hypothetical protein
MARAFNLAIRDFPGRGELVVDLRCILSTRDAKASPYGASANPRLAGVRSSRASTSASFIAERYRLMEQAFGRIRYQGAFADLIEMSQRNLDEILVEVADLIAFAVGNSAPPFETDPAFAGSARSSIRVQPSHFWCPCPHAAMCHLRAWMELVILPTGWYQRILRANLKRAPCSIF